MNAPLKTAGATTTYLFQTWKHTLLNSCVVRILLQGARARGARVPKFVVTKSSRSESHLVLGLQKRIWLKFFATACHSNWWLGRSNFELTELGRKISTAIVWTAAKFASIRKLQGCTCSSAPCLPTPLLLNTVAVPRARFNQSCRARVPE